MYRHAAVEHSRERQDIHVEDAKDVGHVTKERRKVDTSNDGRHARHDLQQGEENLHLSKELLPSFKFFQSGKIRVSRLAATAKNKDEHEKKKKKARGEHGD